MYVHPVAKVTNAESQMTAPSERWGYPLKDRKKKTGWSEITKQNQTVT